MTFIEFDPAKSAKNRRERGIGFELFADMDLDTAISVEDSAEGLWRTAFAGAGPH